jgi:hypothetical protein
MLNITLLNLLAFNIFINVLVCHCEPVIVVLVGRRFGGVVPQSQVRQV